MNADSPQEPAVPPVPPGQPQMVPPPQPAAPAQPQMTAPPQPGPQPQTGPPHHMGPPQMPGPQPMLPPPPPSDRPSPVGLAVAGVGLALLCISMLVPRVKIDDPDGEMAYFSFSFSGTGGFGIDTANVVLSVALLAAVGMSAHRSPALRWPSRLGAIGTAALLAAFAYHPVTIMRQAMDAYTSDDGFEDEDADYAAASEIDITADSGVYLVLVAAILLALSTFLMQTNPRRNQFLTVQQMQPPPGNNPTVTVNPG